MMRAPGFGYRWGFMQRGGGEQEQFGLLSFTGSEQSGTLSFTGSEQTGDFERVND